MPAGEISTAIHSEQVRAVFRQMPIALAVNLVNAALTLIVLSPIAAASALPAIWFSAVVLVTAGRWILWRRYRRRLPQSEHHWSQLATRGSLLAGSCWDLGGVVLFPLVLYPGRSFSHSSAACAPVLSCSVPRICPPFSPFCSQRACRWPPVSSARARWLTARSEG